jgi:hypothetical protein
MEIGARMARAPMEGDGRERGENGEGWSDGGGAAAAMLARLSGGGGEAGGRAAGAGATSGRGRGEAVDALVRSL